MRLTSKGKRLLLKAMGMAGMTAVLVGLIVSYHARDEQIEQLRAQLDVLNTQYYTESMRGNALSKQISQANTEAFIERVARREYGYTNEGEIHYNVSNLPSGAVAVEADNLNGAE